jgi:hypothetical protein
LSPDWPARFFVGPAGLANEESGSEIHLDDRIISPLIGVAHFSHGMHHRRTVACIATLEEMLSE